MSHHHDKPNHPFCMNCYYPIASLDKYCPQCGQKPTTGRVTLHDLWHELIHTTLHLDGKFFNTLRDLLVPGRLTKEFFLGHHVRYSNPVPMVLVLGSFCFFAFNLSLHHQSEDEYKNLRKRQMQYHKQEFVVDLDSMKTAAVRKATNSEEKKALTGFIDSVKKNYEMSPDSATKKEGDIEFGKGAMGVDAPILSIQIGDNNPKLAPINKPLKDSADSSIGFVSDFKKGWDE